MTGPSEVTAEPGQRRTVQVQAPGATGCTLDEARARRILGRPARTLTLEDAAYAVGWLAQAGRITLTDEHRQPKALQFGATCADLVFPPWPTGERGGRFCVYLEPTVQAELRTGGTRPITFVGGHQDMRVATPTMVHNLDVRMVIVAWHLANRMANLDAHGLHVLRILHSGLGDGRNVGSGRIPSRRYPPHTGLIDCHMSGRAIDFDGVLTGADLATATAFHVSRDWHARHVDGMPDLSRDDADATANGWSETAAGWPVAAAGAPNWILVEPKSRFRGDPDAARTAMRTWLASRPAGPARQPFSATRFRLAPYLDDAWLRARTQALLEQGAARRRRGTPAADVAADEQRIRDRVTREAQAAHVFRAALVSLHGDCTAREPMYGAGTDVRAGDWVALADSGSVLHPDHPDPVYRQWHYDHIHAQVGPTAYEWPDDGARARDLRGADAAEVARRRRVEPAHRGDAVVAPRAPAPERPPGA